MPRSQNDQLPATYVVSGIWPTAELAADAPPSAHYSQALARRLDEAIARADIGLRALGERASVSHATISRLRRGQVLPDIGTIARLEATLGAPLCPGLAAAAASEAVRNEELRGAADVPDSTWVLSLDIERLLALPADAYGAMMRSIATIYDVLTEHPELVRSALPVLTGHRLPERPVPAGDTENGLVICTRLT
ncbi:helix-turn-helix domain-containing protein [Streptomyces sp. NPDC055722]